METTDRTKIRPTVIRTRALPEGASISLLDFRGGPAPRLFLYMVVHTSAGCVSIEALPDEASIDAASRELAIDRVPLPSALEALEAFARGEPVDVASVPSVLEGPPFFVKVWTALRDVRRGEVSSYGHLARVIRSPRAMRAVGQAMARNPLPLVVPCHRVIADHARLGNYTGGVERKRALLALEGVEIDGDVVRPHQLGLPVMSAVMSAALDRRAGPR